MARATHPPSPDRLSSADFRALTGAPKRSGPGAAYRALGRLKAGTMNQTETRYAAVLRARELAGEILWWAFQPLKIRLADNTFLTPDFGVLPLSREFEFHDTKGARHLVEEDANAKMKIAAALLPFRFFYAFPRAKAAGGGFEVREVGA